MPCGLLFFQESVIYIYPTSAKFQADLWTLLVFIQMRSDIGAQQSGSHQCEA